MSCQRHDRALAVESCCSHLLPIERTTSFDMMQEILALLSTVDTSDGETSDDLPEELLRECDPLPFPSDVEQLQVPSPDHLGELKRRTRTKLASRRYSRRRKEDAKLQATLATEHNEELANLRALNTMLQHGITASPSQLRDELDVLLRKTRLSANHIFHLYDQLYPGSSSSEADRDPYPDHLSRLVPVSVDCTSSMQFKLALTNARTILRVLSDPVRDGSSGFAVTTFRGWRITEFTRRGSRVCSTASKKLFGMLRNALTKNVWENADDASKRVSTAAHYSSFAPATTKNHPVQDDPCVFYSEELHEFPAPFLSRSFASIHGVHDSERGFWYVKQSLKDPRLHASNVSGSEIFSTVIRDGVSNDGAAFVTVDLIVLYDTHGVTHLKPLVAQDPPLCHRVVEQWERSHLPSQMVHPQQSSL